MLPTRRWLSTQADETVALAVPSWSIGRALSTEEQAGTLDKLMARAEQVRSDPLPALIFASFSLLLAQFYSLLGLIFARVLWGQFVLFGKLTMLERNEVIDFQAEEFA